MVSKAQAFKTTLYFRSDPDIFSEFALWQMS